MIKFTTFDSSTDSGFTIEDVFNPQTFVKTAEAETGPNYVPELGEFIKGLKPKEGKTFLLINALTSGEHYSSNLNGDYFPEDALKKFHKTFETYGHSFAHHKNKSPEHASGKVVFSAYNPKMHRVEIIAEIDNNKAYDVLERISKGDTVKTSMGCFLSGTKVITEGFKKKNIENIQLGDQVYTHTGEFHNVTELHTRQYSGTIYKIKSVRKYIPEINATEEHPWLVIPLEAMYQKHTYPENLDLTNAVWKLSKDLTEDDFLVVPRPKNEVIPCSIEKAKILGWYLAEGHTVKRRNQVTFSTGEGDQISDEFTEAIKIYNCTSIAFRKYPAHSEKLIMIEAHGSKSLKADCLKYCGKYADKKQLHAEIFSWPVEAKLAFLGAYVSGDGYVYDNNVCLSSVNKHLLEQILWLARSVGMVGSIYKNEHKKGHGFSYHDTTEWVVRFRKESTYLLSGYCKKVPTTLPNYKPTGQGSHKSYNDFEIIRIASIDTYEYEGPVYNFEVEKDNSYVVESFAVHNCKLPFDVCSICGKESKRTSDYCDHLKHEMNRIRPDGQKVYAINKDDLKFFDISFVTIPADKTSAVMKKVASAEVIPSAQLGEDFLKEAGIKEADLFKKIDGEIEIASDDPKELILRTTKDLPAEVIKKAAAVFPLNEILSTLLLARIFPKPHQFQDLLLRAAGKDALADEVTLHKHMLMDLGEGPKIPIDINVDKANPELLKLLAPHIPECSLTKPLIMQRIVMMKTAEIVLPGSDTPLTLANINPMSSTKNPIMPMIGLGALYVGYKELFNSLPQAGLESALADKPYLIPLLLGAAAYAATKMQDNAFEKKADVFNPYFIERLLTTVPASYVASGYLENKHRNGEQLNNSEEFVRQHPAITGLGTMYGLGKLIQLMQKHGSLAMKEVVTGTSKETFDKLYNTLVTEGVPAQ